MDEARKEYIKLVENEIGTGWRHFAIQETLRESDEDDKEDGVSKW